MVSLPLLFLLPKPGKIEDRIKILQLCSKPPRPAIDGGCVAMNAMSELVIRKQNADLKIFCLSTQKHPFLKNSLDQDYLDMTQIESTEINTQPNPVQYLLTLASSVPYYISRFHSKAAELKLIEILRQQSFDVIILESLFVAPYLRILRKYSTARIVLRAHNIESHLFRDRVSGATGLKKYFLQSMSNKLDKYEKEVGQQVDGISGIGKGESEFFIQHTPNTPSQVLPNPVSSNLEPITLSKPKIKLFHIGAMDWQPNVEGIDLFINEVWNDELTQHFEFHIAGKALDKEKYKSINGVVNHGFVDSASKFMLQHDVMIVPLVTSSGVRIKILEAMGLGKPVISTKAGFLGIEAQNGKEALLSENIKDISRHLEAIAGRTIDLQQIGHNARKHIETNYNYGSVMDRFFNFLSEIRN